MVGPSSLVSILSLLSQGSSLSLEKSSRGEKTADTTEAILAIDWFPLNRMHRI